MHVSVDSALPPVPAADEHAGSSMWADDIYQYQCLVPMSNRESADVKKALASLANTSAFPAPHPSVLTSEDLWKIGTYPYRVVKRHGGLRMLLCFLQVQGRTVSVLVRENMQVVRVKMGKMHFGAFKGTVLLGYATQEQDGSAGFSVLDVLFHRGANVSRLTWEPRRQIAQTLLGEYSPANTGFTLYLPHMFSTRDRLFWQQIDADDYLSLLFVPEERALKLGAPQSTLFELGCLDVDAVGEAMTQEIVATNGDTFRPRFGLPPPPSREQRQADDTPSAPPAQAAQAEPAEAELAEAARDPPEADAPPSATEDAADAGLPSAAAAEGDAGPGVCFYEVSLVSAAPSGMH